MITTRMLALTALASCPAVYAQATLTIHGRIDVGVATQTNRGLQSVQSVSNSFWLPSQLDFGGTSSLGGGIKAVFALDSTVSVDTGGFGGAGKSFDRQTYVGLSDAGGGTVTLGRQVNTLADSLYVVDPLSAASGATNMNVRFGYLGGPGAAISNNFGPRSAAGGAGLDRIDNAVKYVYQPEMQGFVVAAVYGFGEGSKKASHNSAWGALMGYDAQELSWRSAFMTYKDDDGISFRAFVTGMAYRVAPFTIKVSYTRNWIDSSLDTPAKPYRDMKTWVAASGVSWTITPRWDLNVAYYVGRRSQNGLPPQEARKLYVAPAYRLSPRTSLVAVTLLEWFNETGALLDTGTPLRSGARSSTYLGIGISHVY